MNGMMRKMGSLGNRALNLVNVRAVRTSTYNAMWQGWRSTQAELQRCQAILGGERQRVEELERALEESRLREAEASRKCQELTESLKVSNYHWQRFSDHYHSLKARVDASLVVPLDHPRVVQRRSESYQFTEVLRCFEQHEDAMKQFVAELWPFMYSAELATVPREQQNDIDPFWDNGYFNGDDARMAYAVAAHYQPRTILEIGSGNSTKFFRKAITDHHLQTQLISVDPQPRTEIFGVSDQVILKSVLELGPSFFRCLGAGDVLFLDGSHLVFNGTDVVYLFLEILRSLARGVLLHVHDIMLPWEYDEVFSDRQYNEQYMLAMLLLYSREYVPLGPIKYLYHRNLIQEGGVSFWIGQK